MFKKPVLKNTCISAEHILRKLDGGWNYFDSGWLKKWKLKGIALPVKVVCRQMAR